MKTISLISFIGASIVFVGFASAAKQMSQLRAKMNAQLQNRQEAYNLYGGPYQSSSQNQYGSSYTDYFNPSGISGSSNHHNGYEFFNAQSRAQSKSNVEQYDQNGEFVYDKNELLQYMYPQFSDFTYEYCFDKQQYSIYGFDYEKFYDCCKSIEYAANSYESYFYYRKDFELYNGTSIKKYYDDKIKDDGIQADCSSFSYDNEYLQSIAGYYKHLHCFYEEYQEQLKEVRTLIANNRDFKYLNVSDPSSFEVFSLIMLSNPLLECQVSYAKKNNPMCPDFEPYNYPTSQVQSQMRVQMHQNPFKPETFAQTKKKIQ